MISAIFPLSYNALLVLVFCFILAMCVYCRAIDVTWQEIAVSIFYGVVLGVALTIAANSVGF